MTRQVDVEILEELRSQRRTLNAIMFILAILTFLMAVQSVTANDAVIKDRARFPAERQPDLIYFSLMEVPKEHRRRLMRQLWFTVSSLTRSQVVEVHKPRYIGQGLMRADLAVLGWDHEVWADVVKLYPYGHKYSIRADWFIRTAMDQTRSDLYLRLLFGKEPPKNVTDLFEVIKADRDSEFAYGRIEDESRVAVRRTRLIANFPTSTRTSLWQTFDFDQDITSKNDPLENLLNLDLADASELIGGLPKTSNTGKFGILQFYYLANKAGENQDKAPASIVTDSTNVHGSSEIINPVSCVACHQPDGLREFNVDSFRRYISSGGAVFSDIKTREKIERFYLTGLNRLVDEHNQQYRIGVEMVNGLTPDRNSLEFTETIQAYDADLDLASAAHELRLKEDELKAAIIKLGTNTTARLAGMAHGNPILRTTWEQDWVLAFHAHREWRKTRHEDPKPDPDQPVVDDDPGDGSDLPDEQLLTQIIYQDDD